MHINPKAGSVTYTDNEIVDIQQKMSEMFKKARDENNTEAKIAIRDLSVIFGIQILPWEERD